MDEFRPDDEMLSAWMDGELDADARTRVEAWLRQFPEEAARLRLWAADRDALRSRFDPVLDEPVPEALAALATHGGRRAVGAGWREGRLVAAAAVLFVAGGLVGALLARSGAGEALLAARGSVQPAEPGWARAAAIAHAVYVPEVRHPVEVSVAGADETTAKAQEEHLVRWLTRRMAAPVKLFDLRGRGFELVGGRLLPDANGPSAQLMYQDKAGTRVTVYLRKPENNTETAVRYERDGPLGMFYWVDGGFGYALVGALPREQLLAICEDIYAQVEAK